MAAPPEARRYAVRAADLGREREMIAGLLVEGFPGMSAATIDEKLAIQYLANPAGPAACIVLEVVATGEPAGMQGLVQRKFEAASGGVPAALMADYVIRPAHRTLGPALQLLKGAIDRAKASSTFLYGFPNAKAGVVFTRAGLAPRLQMTRYVHLLRSGAALRRRVKPAFQAVVGVAALVGDLVLAVRHRLSTRHGSAALAWTEPDSFGPEFDELWSGFDRSGLITGVRTARTLGWRFPGVATRRIAFARRGVGGAPVGYVVWSLSERVLTIHDACGQRPGRDLATLLAGFVDRSRGVDAEAIYMEFAGPPELAAAVRSAGFVPRESAPVHLVVADGSQSPEALAASLYLTGFDRDTD